jgi:hypothetical protein
MIQRIWVALVAAALVGGCAATDASVATESPSEREYPTGSNLPRKKNVRADSQLPMGLGVRVHSREDLERMQGSGHGAPSAGSGLSP